MSKNFKKVLFSSLIAMLAFSHFAKADPVCASDAIKPFAGQWNGSGLLISSQGTQTQSTSKDEFAVVDCQSFKISVNYLNAAGTPVRTIEFVASPDSSGEAGLFAIDGDMKEGPTVTKMNGSVRHIQDGTLLLTFLGALGGQPAYFNELMNVTSLPNGDSEIIRSLQIFAGKRGGPYMDSRVTTELKIQNAQ